MERNGENSTKLTRLIISSYCSQDKKNYHPRTFKISQVPFQILQVKAGKREASIICIKSYGEKKPSEPIFSLFTQPYELI